MRTDVSPRGWNTAHARLPCWRERSSSATCAGRLRNRGDAARFDKRNRVGARLGAATGHGCERSRRGTADKIHELGRAARKNFCRGRNLFAGATGRLRGVKFPLTGAKGVHSSAADVETVTNRKNAKKAGIFTPFCDWLSTVLPMLDFRATLRMKHVQQQRSCCGAKILRTKGPCCCP